MKKDLSQKDLQDVLSALDILHRDVDPLTLPERSLQSVLSLIPNEITSFDGFGTDSRYSGYLWYSPPGTVSEERVKILGELVHGHPIFQDIVANKLQKTAKITQYMPLGKFQETALYHEFYKHIGGDTQMMTAFNVSPELYITCSLHRTQKDFTERDLAVLELLAPHLISAFRNAQFVHKLSVAHDSLEEELDDARYGIITIDEDLKISHHNLTAIKLLHEYFLPTDGLPEELVHYIRNYNTIFSPTEVYTPPPPLIVEKVDAKLKIRLTFQSQNKTVVIFLEEIKKTSPADLLKLGLTERESEILYWMAEGKTDAVIAQLGCISVRTVHKHREHIFIKLGVETRTAAAAMAISIMSLC